MKLAYSTWGMPTVPVDISIPHLAKLGFDGLELTVIPGYTTELSRLNHQQKLKIQQLLHQHQLTLTAISAHTSLMETGTESSTGNIQRLKQAVDLAVEGSTRLQERVMHLPGS